jgi:hypothetical protein
MATDSTESSIPSSQPSIGSAGWWDSEDPGGVGIRAWVGAFEAARTRRALAMLSAEWARVITAEEAVSVPFIAAQIQRRATAIGTVSRAVEDADSAVPIIAKLRASAGAGPRELVARASELRAPR